MTAALARASGDLRIVDGAIDAGARARRDAFVRAHPAGTFFHLSGWAAAAHCAYGYEPVCLEAYDGETLAGVLTLSDVRAPLTGRALISSAFSVGGGALAGNDAQKIALMAAAAAHAGARDAAYVECRAGQTAPGWRCKSGHYAAFSIDVLETDEAQLAAIPRKRRAEVRKAIAAAETGAMTIRFDGAAAEFYPLYAGALHRLGTPVFPKRFLSALLDAFDGDYEIAIVEHRGKIIAALVSFYFGDTVLPYYVGASAEARDLRAFDFLYWRVLRRAAARGVRRFDFGRSRIGAGSYDYKRLWGAQETPVDYAIKLLGRADTPNLSPDNPKFSHFVRLWPRLPARVANSLGPLLAPNFP